jgi:hypothetical protein
MVAGGDVLVAQLIDPVGAGLAADAARLFDHRLEQPLGRLPSLAGDDDQVGAERRHLVPLLAAEGVGGDDADAVAAHGAHEGERGPGAAAGVLDDGVSGMQPAVGRGAVDDGARHPILHAAARVLPLELDEDGAAPFGDDPAQRDEGGVADGLEDVHEAMV